MDGGIGAMLIPVAAFVVGAVVGLVAWQSIKKKEIDALRSQAGRALESVESQIASKRKEMEIAAREHAYKLKQEFDKSTEEKRKELQSLDDRLINREKMLDKKFDQLDQRESSLKKLEDTLNSKSESLDVQKAKYDDLISQQVDKLQSLAHMTADEAKNELKEYFYQEARTEAANLAKKIEDEARASAEQNARKVMVLAIQRFAADVISESTVSVIPLPSDDMKGRIIGREGRNVRALEVATGVDFIIDDTPEAIIVSTFDPVKREIARQSVLRLIQDGRIHPGRIEEIVAKVKKDLDTKIKAEGEKAVFELGITKIHPEIVKLLGRLKYRTSYSQSVLLHSIEVAYLCGVMAEEIGLNAQIARRAGLLHDIGKSVDHQTEGTHTQIGVEIAKKYNEPKEVIDAIKSHHEDSEPEYLTSVLVAAADALSASRPGARREMLETYIKRLEQLEQIGKSFDGVERLFAIQAGREVRVMVEPEKIKDTEAYLLAKDIAKKIEKEMAYPGEIKVTVIRETRATEYAR